MKKKDDKAKEIRELKEAIQNSRNILLGSFQGITVAQDTELRRKIGASKSKYKVVKNTLAKIAAKDTVLEPLVDQFKGTTSMAFNPSDPVALAKVLTQYAKDHPVFTFKAGIVEGRVVSMSALASIAELPSREELLSKLLFVLKAPVQQLATVLQATSRNLAVVLSEVSKQKSGGASSA